MISFTCNLFPIRKKQQHLQDNITLQVYMVVFQIIGTPLNCTPQYTIIIFVGDSKKIPLILGAPPIIPELIFFHTPVKGRRTAHYCMSFGRFCCRAATNRLLGHTQGSSRYDARAQNPPWKADGSEEEDIQGAEIMEGPPCSRCIFLSSSVTTAMSLDVGLRV